MTLTTQHRQRWEAAKSLFLRLKHAAAAQGEDGRLTFDGDLIKPEQLVVSDEGVWMVLRPGITIIMFEVNPEYDHGLYTSIAEYERMVRRRFKLVREVSY